MASHNVRALPLAPDRGDIVVGWLARIVVVIGLASLVAFDGIAVVSTRFTVEDQAVKAAQTGSETWRHTHSVAAALADATSSALASDATNRLPADQFVIDPDGTVHLTLTRLARTLVSSHIGPLRRASTVTVNARARSTAP